MPNIITGSGVFADAGQAAGVNAKPPLEADEDVRQYVESRLNEAVERVTFHRTEVKRWERIARACAAAHVQIDSTRPVEVADAAHFVPADQTQAIR